MSHMKKVPTMKDVAREAGVALGTVSKVFNGLPVGEEYKQRVEAAAQKLGYQVNVYARGMRAKTTNTVALILPTLNHPFYSLFADYCCDFLHKKGYRMLLSTTSYNPRTEQECIDMVQQNKVAGVIAITYNPDLEISEGLPFVIIDRKFDAKVPCISSDNFAGGQLAAEKLVENGCKNLLFLGNSSEVPGEADKRVVGFEAYCIANSIPYHKVQTIGSEGYASITEFVSKHITPEDIQYDGIFCNTDSLACIVLSILQSNNIRVPEDVQIIGYDGIKKLGTDDYYCSTISQPLCDMAETSVNTLLSSDKTSAPALVCLPVKYCYGKTTKS